MSVIKSPNVASIRIKVCFMTPVDSCSQISVSGPRTTSFLKVKVTLTLREVILCHDNKHLLFIFRSGFAFNRLSTSTTDSLTLLSINILDIKSNTRPWKFHALTLR